MKMRSKPKDKECLRRNSEESWVIEIWIKEWALNLIPLRTRLLSMDLWASNNNLNLWMWIGCQTWVVDVWGLISVSNISPKMRVLIKRIRKKVPINFRALVIKTQVKGLHPVKAGWPSRQEGWQQLLHKWQVDKASDRQIIKNSN